MGTQTSLTSCAASRESGIAELETFIGILEAVEDELSTWRAESRISELNRQPLGVPLALTADLSRMFESLFSWHKRTNKTFDPGIGALTDVWGIHDGGRVPGPEQLVSALQRSGLQHFSFDAKGQHITRKKDATIDVGGFGKGEGLERILRYAKANNSSPFVIDLGGQVLAHGHLPGKSGWELNLAHPIHRDTPTLSLTVTHGSLSTSAGAERDVFVGGKRIGHIIDPRTGQPVLSRGSVTVWHASPLVADILSTALYVMGPKEGIEWADSIGIAALFQLPDLKATRSWREMFPGA